MHRSSRRRNSKQEITRGAAGGGPLAPAPGWSNVPLTR
jgi:hypothetical protein